jgi:hypothetical protein
LETPLPRSVTTKSLNLTGIVKSNISIDGLHHKEFSTEDLNTYLFLSYILWPLITIGTSYSANIVLFFAGTRKNE